MNVIYELPIKENGYSIREIHYTYALKALKFNGDAYISVEHLTISEMLKEQLWVYYKNTYGETELSKKVFEAYCPKTNINLKGNCFEVNDNFIANFSYCPYCHHWSRDIYECENCGE